MAKAPSKHMRSIENRIYNEIVSVLRKVDSGLASKDVSEAKLGEVKDFGVLVQEAQLQGVPLSQADKGDDTQKKRARSAFRQISDNILKRMSLAHRVRSTTRS